MWLTATAVLFALMLPGARPATANGSSPSRGAPESILDVPFVPQERMLCGGACLAMVMRYHGTPALRADDFAAFVDAKGGIRAAQMVPAAEARDYTAHASSGDLTTLRTALADREPVIVLVDASARLMHYVVVVGMTEEAVIYHDPARRPAMSESLHEFEGRWDASGRWLLTLEARGNSPRTATTRAAVWSDSTDADSSAVASRRLAETAAREFRERRWSESRTAAEEALALDPRRASAWHILGAARYMMNEPDAALEAWNRVNAPTLDLVRVQGLARTRQSVITAAMKVDDDALLTPESLRLVRRQLELIPAVTASRVDYRPIATARADLDVAVHERSTWRPSATQLGVVGVRAITERTLFAAVSSPTGGGEVIEASYRWWENRPRAELALTTPDLFGWQGMTSIAVVDEVQTYSASAPAGDHSGATSASRIVETTREGTIERRQWFAPAWRFDARVGFHQVRERGNYTSLGSALMWATADDRCRVRAAALLWNRIDDGEALHARLDVSADQRAAFSTVIELETRAGWSVVDAAAPRSLWSGAGTGPGRDMLLRAHPLLTDGVMTGDAFAPSLFTAGTEATHWMLAGLVGAALFVDGACPISAAEPARLMVDGGLGVRIHPPGEHGYVRIDFATGLTESARAFSVAWQANPY